MYVQVQCMTYPMNTTVYFQFLASSDDQHFAETSLTNLRSHNTYIAGVLLGGDEPVTIEYVA